jgi:peptidoglycan/LPS O-acetylase OafA/YrhL
VNHNNNFDLLRLLAAVQVVSLHAGQWLQLAIHPQLAWLLSLFPGVPIFFVISGFLVTGSFLRTDSTAGYLFKRALRIYPGMWANLVVIFAMAAVTNVITTYRGAVIYFAVVSVTGSTLLASRIVGLPFSADAPFFAGGVLWTIAVELGFYLAVPLMFARGIRTRPRLLWSVWSGTVLASCACQWWQQTALDSDAINANVPPYLWVFLLGSAACLLWDRIRIGFEGQALPWLASYLIFSWLTSAAPDFKMLNVLNLISMVLLAGVVLSAAYSWPSVARVLRGQDFSYGIYLYHMPVIGALTAAGVRQSWWSWPLVYALTALVAGLSWFFIERPALRAKRLIEKSTRVAEA